MLALSLILGLALLVIGGDVFVRGAVATAERLGVPTLVIGLTLVGFGTSLPELATSVDAALRDLPGIAIGNVVGSNIANILLILAFAAIMRPVVVERAAFRRDGTVVFLSALAAVGVMAWGEVDRLVGGVFIVALLAYVAWCYAAEAGASGPRQPAPAGADVARGGAHTPPAPPQPARRDRSLVVALGSAAVGLALILFGARLLVDGAVTLATLLGVSETVIGLTVVAVGTSLPELATTVAAAVRRETDVAFGNVVGSNIFNVLFILGTTALVTPIAVPAEIMRVDVWVMLGATVILVAVALTGTRITRLEGALMLAAYCGYIGYLATASSLLG